MTGQFRVSLYVLLGIGFLTTPVHSQTETTTSDSKQEELDVAVVLLQYQNDIRFSFPLRAGMSEEEVDALLEYHQQRNLGPDRQGPMTQKFHFFVWVDELQNGRRYVMLNCLSGWSVLEISKGKLQRVWFQIGNLEIRWGEPYLISGKDGEIPQLFPGYARDTDLKIPEIFKPREYSLEELIERVKYPLGQLDPLSFDERELFGW